MQLWDRVWEQHRDGLLPSNFFAHGDRWLIRAVEYRHLVEPLDIANWYFRNYQWEHAAANGCAEEGYHYADGITDELRDDNHRRPDRFLLLQRMEVAAEGSAESSLGAAHRLKALLGNRRWQDVAAAALCRQDVAALCRHRGSTSSYEFGTHLVSLTCSFFHLRQSGPFLYNDAAAARRAAAKQEKAAVQPQDPNAASAGQLYLNWSEPCCLWFDSPLLLLIAANCIYHPRLE
jgi:hypothetical protein